MEAPNQTMATLERAGLGAERPATPEQALATETATTAARPVDTTPADGADAGINEVQAGPAEGGNPSPGSTSKTREPFDKVTGLQEALGNVEKPKWVYTLKYDEYGLPATLLDWRRQPQMDRYTARCVPSKLIIVNSGLLSRLIY